MGYKHIHFKGEYAKLKSMGYQFQRLYAGNYMQWCSDGGEGELRVWKRGAQLTVGPFLNCDGNLLEKLIALRESGTQLMVRYGFIPVWVNRQSNEVSFDDDTHSKEEIDHMILIHDAIKANESPENIPPYNWYKIEVKPQLIADIMKLYDMGWIEVKNGCK